MAALTDDPGLLDLARQVLAAIEHSGAPGAVVGGIAVFLHGYERTTRDIDVYTEDLQRVADALAELGFEYESDERQFVKDGVPVHLLNPDRLAHRPVRFEELEHVRTVTLAELLNMKLHSGTTNVLRAIDLADVIGLIRHNKLTGAFVPHIDKPVRSEFRKLVRAIEKEGG